VKVAAARNVRGLPGIALAALVVVVGGCASGGTGDDAPPEPGVISSAAASGCPMPAGVETEAGNAVEGVNRLRKLAGLGCLELSQAIGTAATRHCSYYRGNSGSCVSKPHKENAGCAGFSGSTFEERLRAASYEGRPAFEVMAYVGRGMPAVEEWLGSIWHRLPLLSPRVDQAGYGDAAACDTMDFGASGRPLEMKVAHYPFADEIGIPTYFDGHYESPEPPPPPDGWPSGFPITVWASGLEVEEHALTVDATGAAVDHIWVTPHDQRAMGLLVDEQLMYAYRPLAPQTRYRVRVVGTRDGVRSEVSWTFTTK
jgi:uncharacterized protein YkwD